MHDATHFTMILDTVEPHLSEPCFNRTPRLFQLFANPPKFRILLTELPLFRTKFRVPLEKKP